MTIWIIEPRDPLIVRDGRPFGPNPGARAQSLPFPFPSTITGGVRTQAGLDQSGIFNTGQIETVKKIGVRGPLLVQLESTGEVATWLIPAPADALVFPLEKEKEGESENNPINETEPEKKPIQLRRLVPLQPPTGSLTDLTETLNVVGLTRSDQRKPFKDAPQFWYWGKFSDWLLDPGPPEKLPKPSEPEQLLVKTLGHQGPRSERRMHVSINSETLTGEEGALFQTSGLEFTYKVKEKKQFTVERLALALDTTGILPGGVAPLGGERRLMQWRQSDTPWPHLPDELKSIIVKQAACRIILLTPAYFTAGYHPAWLLAEQHGVTPELKAVAVQRPQVVSGWDFEKGGPKFTRRLAPAGSVYFLSLMGNKPDAIEQWVEAMWMQAVSDNDQDRWDGFGLAVPGAWSGKLVTMEVA